MIKEAQTKMGRIFFGVLCDGMGGLSNGELASATVIRAMEQWFETDFPQLLVHTTDAEEVLEKVKNDWHVIANELNVQLARYVEGTGNRMGTTIVTLLLIKNQYFIMNVGDSRAYALSNQVYQLTKDQSLVHWFVRRMRRDIRSEMCCYSVLEHRRKYFRIFTEERYFREVFSFCAVTGSVMRSVNRNCICSYNLLY